MDKSPEAFRTISEVADWLGTPAHVLRFWESRFSQVKPIKRAGGRRYYRPSDMALLGGIKKLLHDDGMTIRGVQKMLREDGVKHVAALSAPLDGFVSDATDVDDIEDAEELSLEVAAEAPDNVVELKPSQRIEDDSRDRLVDDPGEAGVAAHSGDHLWPQDEEQGDSEPDTEDMFAASLDAQVQVDDVTEPEPAPTPPAPGGDKFAAMYKRLLELRERMEHDSDA